MSKRRLRSTGYERRIRMWKLLMAAVAATLVLGVGGAGAGHEPGAVKSYTGCLSGGTIYNVREGETPTFSCVFSPTIHLSGGDITAVRAGPGLTGGSENGAATIGLGAGFSLPQGCATGAVPKWNGTAWACGTDIDTDTDTKGVPETFAVFSATVTIDRGDTDDVHVECPAGSVVTGGGFFIGDAQIHLSEKSGNGWLVMGSTSLFTPSASLRAHATCLRMR